MRNSSRRSAITLFAGLGGAFGALLLFSWLAAEIGFRHTLAFDNWGRQLIHSHATPALTAAMRFITLFGTPEVMLPLGAAFLIWSFAAGRRRAAWLFLVSVSGGFLLDISLKEFFARVRPEPFFGTPLPHSYSFPSGHALFSVCFYGTLAVLTAQREKRFVARFAIVVTAALFAILIGLSRVYLGVHYPSDVLAGYSAATVWLASVGLADRWLRRRRDRREPEGRAGAA